MAYLMTGDRRYLDAAKQWALAACGYPTWGFGPYDGKDLATGHQLLGLALVYDWCYHDLDEASRQRIRETLTKRASAMFQAAATGNTYWHRSYMQNHLWVNVCGLAAAGFALFDEVPEARQWIGLALDKFRRTMDALGPDGASHEGVGYWEYGAEYMLKFMSLADTLLNVDLYDRPWWRNTAEYCQYLSLPVNAWTRSNCIVDLADCPRGHWYGPDHILRHLAGRYRDGHAQWLAEQIDKADVDAPGARWLNLIWYDPAVPAVAPQDLPTLRHFEDMGLVSARTGWDGKESLLVFKCGPFIGHQAVDEFSYDPGGGHVHPDVGHFVLFGAGQWLIRDDGYQDKWTDQHNTLLIDGVGQLGEGHQWFNGTACLSVKSRPRILRATSSTELGPYCRRCDGGLSETGGAATFRASPVVCQAGCADRDRRHRPGEKRGPGAAPAHGKQRRQTGRGSLSRDGPPSPSACGPVDAGQRQNGRGQPAGPWQSWRGANLFTIRFTNHDSRWRNAVALSWAPVGSEAKRLRLARTSRCGRSS